MRCTHVRQERWLTVVPQLACGVIKAMVPPPPASRDVLPQMMQPSEEAAAEQLPVDADTAASQVCAHRQTGVALLLLRWCCSAAASAAAAAPLVLLRCSWLLLVLLALEKLTLCHCINH